MKLKTLALAALIATPMLSSAASVELYGTNTGPTGKLLPNVTKIQAQTGHISFLNGNTPVYAYLSADKLAAVFKDSKGVSVTIHQNNDMINVKESSGLLFTHNFVSVYGLHNKDLINVPNGTYLTIDLGK